MSKDEIEEPKYKAGDRIEFNPVEIPKKFFGEILYIESTDPVRYMIRPEGGILASCFEDGHIKGLADG